MDFSSSFVAFIAFGFTKLNNDWKKSNGIVGFRLDVTICDFGFLCDALPSFGPARIPLPGTLDPVSVPGDRLFCLPGTLGLFSVPGVSLPGAPEGSFAPGKVPALE